MNNDKFLAIGIGIIFGGLFFVFYLASIFGPSLPGWTLLVPVAIGGGIMTYPMVFGDNK